MPVIGQHVSPGPLIRPRAPWEHLWVRYPRLYERVMATGTRLLSPRSRMRQNIIRRESLSGWAAANRRDYELMMTRYRRDVVIEWMPDLASLGLPPRSDGTAAWAAAIGEFNTTWAETEYLLRFVIDMGKRFVLLGDSRFRGATSGVGIDARYAQVIDHERGMVVRELDFRDWGEALAAAGISASDFARLEATSPGAVVELG